jgi:hypothetical protein
MLPIVHTGVAMHALLFSILFSWAASAQSIIYSETIQGGVSVDGQAVSAHGADWNCAPYDLEVQVPDGSTIEEVYAIVHAKWSYGFNGEPAANIKINSTTLDNADRLTAHENATYWRVYSLDPDTFDIEADDKYYSYCEHGGADYCDRDYWAGWGGQNPDICDCWYWGSGTYCDPGYHGGAGVTGTVLVVIYTNPDLSGRRHVSVSVDYINNHTKTFGLMPTSGAHSDQRLSTAITWECSGEQNGKMGTSSSASTHWTSSAGGRDDSRSTDPGPSCGGNQDYNSLFTVGSFGVNDSDDWVGLDSAGHGDDAFNGTDTAWSRASHELYLFTNYDNSGSRNLYYYGDGDSWLGAVVWVTEMDADGDGTADADDSDADNDGVSNSGDNSIYYPYSCQDLDGDGCDDCSIGVDGFGGADDFNVANDGDDYDYDYAFDLCPLLLTQENCEDGPSCLWTGSACIAETLCDLTDPDIDGDGVANADDPEEDDEWSCGSIDDDDDCDDCIYFWDNEIGDSGVDGIRDIYNDGPDDDGDGECDFSDEDDDGDGCDDVMDNCQFDVNPPDILHCPTPGVWPGEDPEDRCDSVFEGGVRVAGCQPDDDGDGVGNICDGDGDGDGFDNEDDNCPWVYNPGYDSGGGVFVQYNADLAIESVIEGDACDTCTDSDGDEWGDGGINPEGHVLQWIGCVNSGDYDNCSADLNNDQADNDSDDEGDVCDDDDDNDDVDDFEQDGTTPLDNCQFTYNPDQANNDAPGWSPSSDSMGDLCDDNDDNDAYSDENDNCPFSVNDDTTAYDQTDYDVDGLGDLCDPCTDSDEDGFPDPGYLEGYDERGNELVGGGCGGAPADNCPDTYNPDQVNSDGPPDYPGGDGYGDACDECTDPDDDGYGSPPDNRGCAPIPNTFDNCPDIYNIDQLDTDNDHIGDVCDECTDSDNDLVGDPGFTEDDCEGSDNCVTAYNPNQADEDLDGIGDACDMCTDSDGDGWGDEGEGFFIDECPESGTVYDNCVDDPNPDQTDTDGDGDGNACDDDDDGDGFTDAEENALGLDPTSTDSDGDTILDVDELTDPADPEDTDGDGTIDALDTDSDDDGISDADEAGDANLASSPVDTDGDGTADFRDTDSDDDTIDDDTDKMPATTPTTTTLSSMTTTTATSPRTSHRPTSTTTAPGTPARSPRPTCPVPAVSWTARGRAVHLCGGSPWRGFSSCASGRESPQGGFKGKPPDHGAKRRGGGVGRTLTMLLIALAAGSGASCLGQAPVDEDGDGVLSTEDCDDTRPRVHPGAPEVCDGIDNDCDGEVDEAGARNEEVFHADVDGDGFGDPDHSVRACTAPSGYVADARDCDDGHPQIHPGATEYCDEVDQDCDGNPVRGAVDPSLWFRDIDGDGYGDPTHSVHACSCPDQYAATAGDCDDLNDATSPDGEERCDGVDNDCDGAIDEDDASDALDWYADLDGDGYGAPPVLAHSCEAPSNLVDDSRDCNDGDPAIHPFAPEPDCGDPVDYNCDGSVGNADIDFDGFPACQDCDEGNAQIHPDAIEICDRNDNDCDGEVDEGPPDTAPRWYVDSDGDGDGNAEVFELGCTAPEGYVADGGDCDDNNDAVHSGHPEICDGLDNNCDGVVDESNAALIYPCDAPPPDAEARCFRAECTVVCSSGATDVDGDLQDPLGNGCEGAYTGPIFTDVTSGSGISYVQWDPTAPDACGLPHGCEMEWWTGGAAAADYDNDGWIDLFVTRIHDTDILYRNRGNGTFEDVSQQVGLTMALHSNGAVWGDIDNDGDLDLYVTAIGDERFFLLVNQGGTFVEDAVARGAAVPSPAPHAGFSVTMADYDRDGWLDIRTNEWRLFDSPAEANSHARLLRNLGPTAPGEFEDVTTEAGIADAGLAQRGIWAFTSAFVDFDQDGWLDLANTADFGTSTLFWNNGDGTFSDGTAAAAVNTGTSQMGTMIGDYDGDGWLDWFVTQIAYTEGAWGFHAQTGNAMYRNNGDRTFTDLTDEAGVRHGYWAWGSALFDYDNDGDLDLAQANGYSLGPVVYEQDPMRFWRNEGGLFTDLAEVVGVAGNRLSGKGLIVFDYDNDGDLDLFVVNNSAQPSLYRNDGGNTKDWLRVELAGRDRNLQGIGARITVRATPDSAPMVREIRAGGQLLGQSEITAHFGLGDDCPLVDEVRVRWPETGEEQVLTDVPRNQLLVIEEPE